MQDGEGEKPHEMQSGHSALPQSREEGLRRKARPESANCQVMMAASAFSQLNKKGVSLDQANPWLFGCMDDYFFSGAGAGAGAGAFSGAFSGAGAGAAAGAGAGAGFFSSCFAQPTKENDTARSSARTNAKVFFI